MKFNEVLTVSLTLFAVIDIIGAIPVVLSLKQKIKHIQSEKTTLAAGALMIAFLFFGAEFLSYLGLDIKSFAVAGSIVMFIIALEMVLGINIFRTDPDTTTGSIVPIAFPVIAGSGTLTTIMSLKAMYDVYTILSAIAFNLIIIYVVLKSSSLIERALGANGMLLIRKFFGLILMAIAVKVFKSNII